LLCGAPLLKLTRLLSRTQCPDALLNNVRRWHERAFAEQGKAINEKVRLNARVGAAFGSARERGRDPYAAIEATVPWDAFSRSVTEAECELCLSVYLLTLRCPGSWDVGWQIRHAYVGREIV
jgi:hypothetical protein